MQSARVEWLSGSVHKRIDVKPGGAGICGRPAGLGLQVGLHVGLLLGEGHKELLLVLVHVGVEDILGIDLAVVSLHDF